MLLSQRCNNDTSGRGKLGLFLLKNFARFFFPPLCFITVYLSQVPDTYLRKKELHAKALAHPTC